MSIATNRLRRAGVGGVAAVAAVAALTVGGTAFAAAGDFTAASAPNVTQGASNQAAGNVTAEFANVFTTNATEKFTIGANDCTTQAGQDAAIGLAGTPTVALTGPWAGTAAGSSTSRKPSYTVEVSSSSAACTTAGIKDVVTVTLTQPSAGSVATDTFKLTVSDIAYNVGAEAPTGDVTVTGAGLVNGADVNAKVVNTSYTFIPVIAAQESSTGNALGTATLSESTAGAYFPTGATTVKLDLADGTFTAGVTPTITVPAGYTVTKPATTDPAASTYTFTVTAPATPTKATVTVSGLKYNAPATAGTDTVTATVGLAVSDALDAVNVLDYNDRTGGADRYGTAAALFTNEFGVGGVNDVVLSGGGLFPDALSANYLAGKLENGNGTGTLLTKANELPAVTRQAILSAGVSTVYITGGTGAVSEAVANEIRSLHVGNAPFNPFISVVRLGGADRYATNKIVNEYNFTSSDTVLLASGNGFADALALGPIAYSSNYPLVLTKGSTLGSTEQSQLSDFSPTNVVIAGGTGVVSQAIEDNLRADGYTVIRLGGADRTLTAAQIATWASVGVGSKTGLSAGPDTQLDSDTVYVTNGLGFADALSAGPVAGNNTAVIMPTAGVNTLGQGLPSYLGSKDVGSLTDGTTVDTLHALGLTGAVSNAVVKLAAASIGQ